MALTCRVLPQGASLHIVCYGITDSVLKGGRAPQVRPAGPPGSLCPVEGSEAGHWFYPQVLAHGSSLFPSVVAGPPSVPMYQPEDSLRVSKLEETKEIIRSSGNGP